MGTDLFVFKSQFPSWSFDLVTGSRSNELAREMLTFTTMGKNTSHIFNGLSSFDEVSATWLHLKHQKSCGLTGHEPKRLTSPWADHLAALWASRPLLLHLGGRRSRGAGDAAWAAARDAAWEFQFPQGSLTLCQTRTKRAIQSMRPSCLNSSTVFNLMTDPGHRHSPHAGAAILRRPLKKDVAADPDYRDGGTLALKIFQVFKDLSSTATPG